MSSPRSNLILGLLVALFSLIVLFVWIPLDVQTGLIEKVRRQVTIGDALAPSVAAVFLLIGGLVLAIVERRDPGQPHIDLRSIGFVVCMITLIVGALVVMRFAGPALVALLNMSGGEPLDYRLLRDEMPWKYIGFFIGGTIMISGCIALVEGRLRPKVVLLSAVIVVVMMAIYDLPFDDLLLPPNGDV